MDHSKQRIDALVQESIIRYNQYMDMIRLLHNIIASIFHFSQVLFHPMVIEIEVTQKKMLSASESHKERAVCC